MKVVVSWTNDKGHTDTRAFDTIKGAWAFAARMGKLRTIVSVTVTREG